jgi:hypothetical protein
VKILKQPPAFKGLEVKCECGGVYLADEVTDFTRTTG